MDPGLFGHMGLHQWGCWEAKLGEETKAPSLFPSLSPLATAGPTNPLIRDIPRLRPTAFRSLFGSPG